MGVLWTWVGYCLAITSMYVHFCPCIALRQDQFWFRSFMVWLVLLSLYCGYCLATLVDFYRFHISTLRHSIRPLTLTAENLPHLRSLGLPRVSSLPHNETAAYLHDCPNPLVLSAVSPPHMLIQSPHSHLIPDPTLFPSTSLCLQWQYRFTF